MATKNLYDIPFDETTLMKLKLFEKYGKSTGIES